MILNIPSVKSVDMIFQGFYIVLSNGASAAAGLAMAIWPSRPFEASVKAKGTAGCQKKGTILAFFFSHRS